MLSRRAFGRLITAALAAGVIVPGRLMGQAQPGADESGPQFSVMMWALNKRGSFEENLERVAEAGVLDARRAGG